jgi:hypothetical protein
MGPILCCEKINEMSSSLAHAREELLPRVGMRLLDLALHLMRGLLALTPQPQPLPPPPPLAPQALAPASPPLYAPTPSAVTCLRDSFSSAISALRLRSSPFSAATATCTCASSRACPIAALRRRRTFAA